MYSIQVGYRNVVLNFPIVSMEKDIHALLWKQCFYKEIDIYRKKLRELDSEMTQMVGKSKTIDSNMIKINIMRATDSFGKYLDDAIVFYTELMLEFELKVQQTPSDQANLMDAQIHGIFRCLLYLGDLARYYKKL